jgi:AraC-like DNA-binding protein
LHTDLLESLPVAAELAPFVRRFLYAEGGARATVAFSPFGCVYLGHVFNDGDVRAGLDGAPQRYRSGWHVWGPMYRAKLDVRYRGEVGHLLAEFTPTGFHRLFGHPAPLLADRAMELSGFDPALAANLRQAIAGASNREARLGAFESVLRAKIASARREPASVAAAVEAFERSGGTVRIAVLCGELGISARQLNRSFSAHVGLPPKLFAQICQIRRAATLLARADAEALSAIAIDCGFYDQAHFSRALRRFLGAVPRTYRRAAIAAGQGA